jgi:hypothetical protein
MIHPIANPEATQADKPMIGVVLTTDRKRHKQRF